MLHHMNLNPEPFEMIVNHEKCIELRLNDEKRRKIRTGDTIVFANTADPDQRIYARVTALYQYPSYEELFEHVFLTDCGYPDGISIAEAAKQMEEYYPAEKIRKYGVLGIRIE